MSLICYTISYHTFERTLNMYNNKKILLIAGGGTLGTYTSKELIRLGARVDVICPEDKISDHENLRFYQAMATDDFLTTLFSKNHYDAIVNFIHYEDPEEYYRVYPMLRDACDHLVFLSSYRVYADEVHPVSEDAPRLYDVLKDQMPDKEFVVGVMYYSGCSMTMHMNFIKDKLKSYNI